MDGTERRPLVGPMGSDLDTLRTLRLFSNVTPYRHMTSTSTLLHRLAAMGSGLLILTQVEADPAAPGRRILAGDDSTKRLAVIAADGSVEWEIPVTSIHDASVLSNGNILLQQGWTRVQEVSRDRQVVWEYDAAKANPGRPVEVHAFQRLPDGLTMIAESGPARIIEVDRSGSIKREVKLQVDHPNAHADTRLVRKLANGNYLVAHEADGRVREYDATGKIVWQFDVPLFGRQRRDGHGPEAFGNSVFSAARLPNGNTLIGTGNGHSILEVDRQGTIVWKVEQHDLSGITLAWVTRVERLPNGNTLIGNCHAGPDHPQLIEVTPDRKVVWTWKDFTHFGNSTPVVAVLGPKP